MRAKGEGKREGRGKEGEGGACPTNKKIVPAPLLMPWLQLWFDYNTTTIQLRSDYDVLRAPASNSMQTKKWTCQFFVIVVSQSNRMHIVFSITSVIVECIVVSSYRSRMVVESQLWYRLYCLHICHTYAFKRSHDQFLEKNTPLYFTCITFSLYVCVPGFVLLKNKWKSSGSRQTLAT